MTKLKLIIVPVILMIIGAVAGWMTGWQNIKPVSRSYVVKARQYSYDPPSIEANVGDTLHFKFISMDVIHGFYLEAYDVDVEIRPNLKTFKFRKPSEGHIWKDTTGITVVADKTGKFRYRCSHTCGNMHPFMMGELIVRPNNLLHISLGVLIGLVLGILYVFYKKIKKVSENEDR